MATVQHRYKQDYDRQVQGTIKFQPGDWVFSNRPPLFAVADTGTAQTALIAFKKLMLWSLGPFHVNAARPHSPVTDEHGIINVLSTDRATSAPHTKHLALTDEGGKRQQGETDLKAKRLNHDRRNASQIPLKPGTPNRAVPRRNMP